MAQALILVDVQNDFLDRPGLYPERHDLTTQIGTLLAAFRAASLPVIHVRTGVADDGSDSMPHWQRQAVRQCLRGTPGAMPPPALAAADSEEVVEKHYFSGFETGRLDALLRKRGVDTVVLAGLYTHGCIRATATDAYQKGYTVLLAAEGIASTDPQHELVSRQWLDGRVARLLANAQILATIGADTSGDSAGSGSDMPAAHIAGAWIDALLLPTRDLFDPCDATRRLARVPVADSALVARAVEAAGNAGIAWGAMPIAERAQLIEAWAQVVELQREAWAGLVARQVGKPIGDAREEMERTVGHLRSCAGLAAMEWESHRGGSLVTRHCPRGTIAVITPWNNPVALPVAKIAAALLFGNSVVWKPALPAPEVARAVVDSLVAAGMPPGLLSMVFGDAATAQALIAHPAVAAVTITGSQRAGLDASLLCARRGIPLQAELGGNNAAVVMADADLDAAARALAGSAFGFAGQRCTATRRIVVEESVRERFTALLLREVAALPVGDPLDPATRVGPLVSAVQRNQVAAAVRRALDSDGGHLLCGGTIPAGKGSWYPPTLVAGLEADAALVQEESFGPVAVILGAAGFTDAMQLCNDVSQGLVASFFGRDPAQQKLFLAQAQAGILRLNPAAFPVAADAPFGGWKTSGMGPPEHGRWDRDFFARPQAIYGELP
jgi:acyl-CoA reductase-like NAD-dependent aldehyde dehydrogenase/nicotinamidase-related amidase